VLIEGKFVLRKILRVWTVYGVTSTDFTERKAGNRGGYLVQNWGDCASERA